MVEARLKGCTSVNLKKLAQEHFTPTYLEGEANRLLGVARRVDALGLPIAYHPTEMDKCVVHYCSRELIADLWNFTMPAVKPLIKEDGRFDVERAQREKKLDNLTGDISDALDTGQEFIASMMDGLFEDWVATLKKRYMADKSDALATMFTIYKTHSRLITGDWSAPTILELTFASAGREKFDWLKESPDMSRVELENIVSASRRGPVEQADQLGIKSAVKEEVLRRATERGELAYVLDPLSQTIIFNPLLLPEVEKEEGDRKADYYDQTALLLQCPAKFVPSSLYQRGSMLRDLIRFRESVFVELYLSTHGRGQE